MIEQPTLETQRADILDVLRGFAMLGIFIAHVPGFSGWDHLEPADQARLDPGMDATLQFVREMFVRGKFVSLFSLLFGFGFAIQHASAQRHGVAFASHFRRRQLGLLVLGVVHSAFWHGDILLTYALLGLLLIPFADCSPRRALYWAFGLLALRGAWGVLMWLLADSLASIGDSAVGDGAGGVDVMGSVSAVTLGYYSSDWSEMLRSNAHFLRLKWLLALYDGRLFSISGFFLLGIALGKWRLHTQLSVRAVELRRVAWIAGGVGLVGNLALAALWPHVPTYPPTPMGVWTNLLYSVAVPALALAMAASIALSWNSATGRRVLGWLGPPGRMALTTYLTETAIGIGVFYGVGLGLRGTISLAGCFATAVVVFIFQSAAAHIWLRAFRYGPFEWAWRCFTYRRVLPLRRTPPAHFAAPPLDGSQ